jgi:hypothetical protein
MFHFVRIALLAQALVLAGCEQAPTSAKFDGSSLSSVQLLAAQDAAAQWCEATHGVCCPEIADNPPIDQKLAESTELPAAVVGRTTIYPDDGSIQIRTNALLSLDRFIPTIRHELGHVCAAIHVSVDHSHEHVQADGRVMFYEEHGWSTWITSDDVAYAIGSAAPTEPSEVAP